jgi:hypothetical protein
MEFYEVRYDTNCPIDRQNKSCGIFTLLRAAAIRKERVRGLREVVFTAITSHAAQRGPALMRKAYGRR